MTIVTTSRKLKDSTFAKQLAESFGWFFLDRNELLEIKNVNEKIIVVEKDRLSLRISDTKFFFHPGLSLLRIKNILEGEGDRLVDACRLRPGDSFLDCTLGAGSDAIVASYMLGSTGKITGLEAVPEVALVTSLGLKKFIFEDSAIQEAARRIEVKTTTAEDYLCQTNNLYDCIYFDPMFYRPNLASSAMNMLRPFALKNPLSKEVITLALQHASRCVVVKEISRKKLEELKPDEILGSKNAKLLYARWNK